MKEKKGVTLIALVITIIIIMILASIAIYSGAGTIRYTKYNKAKSEIQVIQSYVNEWYKEYKKTGNVGNYGELIGTAIDNGKCTQAEIDSTFSGGGITDDNKKLNYRFFSESFLKEEIGLDASFDYLISIKDRNTILFNGIVYNKEIYYTLDDFGLQNIKEISPDSIDFKLEQGENTDIIISDIAIKYKEIKIIEKENKETTIVEVERFNDIGKFIVEYRKTDETSWTDVTKDVIKFEDEGETKFKFSVSDYAQYFVKIFTIDKKKEGSNNIILEARHGIKVGDYIKYTSPTETVSLSTTETGYSSTQTLSRKDTFRVMDIDESGNMTLIGAMTSSDTRVFFQGALGYNNAVYTLNNKCSDLYKDDSKGITARSIKVEDITDRMIEGTKGETTVASTGKKKLEKYQDEQVAALPKGTYITATDLTKNTVTYKTITNYPDIFQYETGGLIDSTATYGVIGQSDSYRGYNGLTILANKTPIPTNLTVPYTYYCVEPDVSDFDNTKGNAAAYENMFFETSTNYWLASRCIGCHSDRAGFRVRTVGDSYIGAFGLYGSGNGTDGSDRCVCPVVYLPAGVQVEVSNNPKNQTNTNGTAHKVK